MRHAHERTTTMPIEPKRRDFQDILTDLDNGRVHEQLSEIWPRVVKAVRENNAPGSITLTLTAKLDRGAMAVVASKITTKMPHPSAASTLFYSDEEGNLSKNDPKQLPLKNVTPIKGGGPS
jgi:hypothetical protein